MFVWQMFRANMKRLMLFCIVKCLYVVVTGTSRAHQLTAGLN